MEVTVTPTSIGLGVDRGVGDQTHVQSKRRIAFQKVESTGREYTDRWRAIPIGRVHRCEMCVPVACASGKSASAIAGASIDRLMAWPPLVHPTEVSVCLLKPPVI
jgi:hypothetical protein